MLYIGTASAEDPEQALRTYDRFGSFGEVTRLEFFPWPPEDLRSTVLDQDLIFVGGGNTANMLAIWRLHGVDELLREALEAGVVLSGSSAGGICWFETGVTDSFGPQLAPMECLGFLPGSLCPHWDDEENRRPRFHELLKGGFPAGYAADAGVGLHFVNGELQGAVGVRRGHGRIPAGGRRRRGRRDADPDARALSSPTDWEREAENWIAWARRARASTRTGITATRSSARSLPPPGRATLEIGCGEGRVPRDLAARGHRVPRSMSAPTMLAAAQEADPGGTYICADAADAPVRGRRRSTSSSRTTR